jgi:uncharacterized integral membrane protein
MLSPKIDPEKTTEIPNEVLHQLIEQRDNVFKRIPLLFTLLGTFGVALTFYGFQHIIAKIPMLADDPYITLGVGVLILLLTGTLYKKLG